MIEVYLSIFGRDLGRFPLEEAKRLMDRNVDIDIEFMEIEHSYDLWEKIIDLCEQDELFFGPELALYPEDIMLDIMNRYNALGLSCEELWDDYTMARSGRQQGIEEVCRIDCR